MWITRKELIAAGERLPRGYRIAYLDFMRGRAAAYPIGIHLIVRLARRLWEATFRYSPSRLEKLMIKLRAKTIKECGAKPMRRTPPLPMDDIERMLYGADETPE